VSGRVGRHERPLRDQAFPVASQGFENAMRQPRSIPQAGRLLRHLRMEQDNPSVFDLLVGDCERAVAEGHFRPAHGRIVPGCRFPPSASLPHPCPNLAGPSAIVCRPQPRQAERAVCPDERRRLWIRGAIRGLTFPPRRRSARGTPVWAIGGNTRRPTSSARACSR
jgi:hypothetical protein